jgi:hypothetical protein
MTANAFIYHALATIAMLSQLVLVGLISLLKLSLSSAPGTEPALLILKVVVAVSWLGLLVLGLVAWSKRSWFVVTVPIASLAALLVVDLIADNTIHWYLNLGY